MIRSVARRAFSVKARLEVLIPKAQERLKTIKKEQGSTVVAQVSADQIIGGMRGIPGLLYETSKLDPVEGIRYRGWTIAEIEQKYAPKAPTPEATLWLLLTGEFPNAEELENISKELKERATVPAEVERLVEHLPRDMHPMTKLSIGTLGLQKYSHFHHAYSTGVDKRKYWEYVLEDSLDLCAKISKIAAIAFVNSYGKGGVPTADLSLDYSANFANMMGFTNPEFHELMRLYLTIHADHEGGNVSAHATQLVSSALSDPYLAFSAGMNGLAGPLHGLANQEVLKWIEAYVDKYGTSTSEKDIASFVNETMASGKVVPGFGHAVLRQTDPRYTSQQRFADRYLPNDPLYQVVKACYKVIPEELKKTGKIKNPWPNVDAHSGVLLQHYGMKQVDFYTVLFGVSRAFGTMSALVWSRALGLPIERPGSHTMDTLEALIKKSSS